MILKFKKLHQNAQLPAHATEDSAGIDLHACLDESVIIHPGEAAAVPTGLAMELPKGMEAQIRGRSGLAFKHAIFSYNGTIDADYRGEIKGLLINHSRVPFTITPGMRICQMVINASYVKCRLEFVEELNETGRGVAGFGSTGYDDIALQCIAHPMLVASGELNEVLSEETLETVEMEDEGDALPESSAGQVRYSPAMGDSPPTKKETMAALLNVSKGKKYE